jgi:hypothetical protein
VILQVHGRQIAAKKSQKKEFEEFEERSQELKVWG